MFFYLSITFTTFSSASRSLIGPMWQGCGVFGGTGVPGPHLRPRKGLSCCSWFSIALIIMGPFRLGGWLLGAGRPKFPKVRNSCDHDSDHDSARSGDATFFETAFFARFPHAALFGTRGPLPPTAPQLLSHAMQPGVTFSRRAKDTRAKARAAMFSSGSGHDSEFPSVQVGNT